MKKLYIVLRIGFLMALAPISLSAQEKLNKEEASQWKKRIRSLKPEDFKALVEERDKLKSENSAYISKIAGLESSLAEKVNEINGLKEQLADKENEMEKLKEKTAMTAPITPRPATGSNPAVQRPEPKSMAGIVFKVQVGAFRNKDLSKYFDNNPNFSGEIDADGQKKYTLGHFTDYWEADTFKKYLREMGVKDAWVVPYKDGKRVAIKDVLEGVVQ